MRTCSKCAVEVEEGIERCPLCGTPLREGLPGLPAEAKEGREPEVSESSVRRWLWEVASLLALTAAAILIAIDLASGFDVTWSRYPLSAIAFLWICATSAIALAKRPLALVAALAAAVVAFLLVLELVTGGRAWFLPLALPLVAMVIAVSAGAWVIVSRLRLSLLPALAVVVLGCGLAAIGTEYILNRYLQPSTVVSWSLVVLACAISLFLALLLIHKRLKERHSDIRRFFHL
jgi:uncharacterized membrane protein